jgi:DHA1 family bicyclomycin/chloramphenicol resistance-like MFS transporter
MSPAPAPACAPARDNRCMSSAVTTSWSFVLVLGLLQAIGPFAIDMYLPALPQIGHSLDADVGAVQMSLTVFFLALGVGQLLYGPVSDRVGRKPPLYVGLCLFTLASVGCALATDVRALVALRFVQGLGAAAGSVIPRAIVRG